MKTLVARAAVSLVVLLGAACSPPQEGASPGSAGSPGAPAAGGSAPDLLALLPPDNTIPGWARKQDVRVYDVGNLWDFIDGGAEAYLACGFQDVVTAEYARPASTSGILVDVYRMKDTAGAFGIYSQERGPAYELKPVGAEGYLSGTALNFWANTYYVKLTAFEGGDESRLVMEQLAEAVSRKLGTPAPPPTSSPYERCGPALRAP